MNLFSRTELLIGKSGMEKLKRARVAVFGIGGVGGYAVEALVRSGIGRLELVDNDQGFPDQRQSSDYRPFGYVGAV